MKTITNSAVRRILDRIPAREAEDHARFWRACALASGAMILALCVAYVLINI